MGLIEKFNWKALSFLRRCAGKKTQRIKNQKLLKTRPLQNRLIMHMEQNWITSKIKQLKSWRVLYANQMKSNKLSEMEMEIQEIVNRHHAICRKEFLATEAAEREKWFLCVNEKEDLVYKALRHKKKRLAKSKFIFTSSDESEISFALCWLLKGWESRAKRKKSKFNESSSRDSLMSYARQ